MMNSLVGRVTREGWTKTGEGVRTCLCAMARALGVRGRAEARVVVLETRWGRKEDVSGVCYETGPARKRGRIRRGRRMQEGGQRRTMCLLVSSSSHLPIPSMSPPRSSSPPQPSSTLPARSFSI